MLQIGFFFKYCMLEKDLNVLLTFSTTPTALYFKHTCLFFFVLEKSTEYWLYGVQVIKSEA